MVKEAEAEAAQKMTASPSLVISQIRDIYVRQIVSSQNFVISRDGEAEAGGGGGGGSLFRKIERGGGGEGPPPASQQALDMSAFVSNNH